MEHEVHQGQAVGVLYMLHTVEGVAAVLALLGLGPGVRVLVAADEKP